MKHCEWVVVVLLTLASLRIGGQNAVESQNSVVAEARKVHTEEPKQFFLKESSYPDGTALAADATLVVNIVLKFIHSQLKP